MIRAAAAADCVLLEQIGAPAWSCACRARACVHRSPAPRRRSARVKVAMPESRPTKFRNTRSTVRSARALPVSVQSVAPAFSARAVARHVARPAECAPSWRSPRASRAHRPAARRARDRRRRKLRARPPAPRALAAASTVASLVTSPRPTSSSSASVQQRAQRRLVAIERDRQDAPPAAATRARLRSSVVRSSTVRLEPRAVLLDHFGRSPLDEAMRCRACSRAWRSLARASRSPWSGAPSPRRGRRARRSASRSRCRPPPPPRRPPARDRPGESSRCARVASRDRAWRRHHRARRPLAHPKIERGLRARCSSRRGCCGRSHDVDQRFDLGVRRRLAPLGVGRREMPLA